MTAYVLRGDARRLPLPDGCVDLIVTSPPYFGLRSYTDGGEHYAGQIGSEPTPQEWLEALWECTAEWVRVLKPEGSLFVNLGDSYYSGKGAPGKTTIDAKSPARTMRRTTRSPLDYGLDYPRKSLLGLPWRYAIGCTDRLGLLLRRDIIWHKPNGLPESVTDRCRSSHEYLFHLVKQPRYYAAVDEIREPHYAPSRKDGGLQNRSYGENVQFTEGARRWHPKDIAYNPLGKLPGSVWTIPSAPLQVPAHLGVDHFAAFPPGLVRPVVLGWSPPRVCMWCGLGWGPVSNSKYLSVRPNFDGKRGLLPKSNVPGRSPQHDRMGNRIVTITGYACACTPYTDHPGTDCTGPWREYHFDNWQPPPTRAAVVLDPFAGTGTTMLVASAYGRIGVGVDLSADYCRLARWRVNDPGERARARDMPKPPPVPDGMEPLFTM